MSALPLGRALEAVRLLPARLAGGRHQPLAGRSFLDVTPIPVVFSEYVAKARRVLGSVARTRVSVLRSVPSPVDSRRNSIPALILVRAVLRFVERY
jgi:hypothetical protein